MWFVIISQWKSKSPLFKDDLCPVVLEKKMKMWKVNRQTNRWQTIRYADWSFLLRWAIFLWRKLVFYSPRFKLSPQNILVLSSIISLVSLFLCEGIFVQLENFSLIWRRYRWRAAAFDLCSLWGFFSVPHLLWHGASVYDGHLRGPVTLTPVAERLAVELSKPVFTT